jgi:hypothetical protein
MKANIYEIEGLVLGLQENELLDEKLFLAGIKPSFAYSKKFLNYEKELSKYPRIDNGESAHYFQNEELKSNFISEFYEPESEKWKWHDEVLCRELSQNRALAHGKYFGFPPKATFYFAHREDFKTRTKASVQYSGIFFGTIVDYLEEDLI